MSQTRERIRQLDIQRLLEQFADHLLHQIGDGLLVHERGFDIELGEFRLTIGAEILVAETADNLIVTIHARHHQQLLVELWGLRQGKEMIRVGATGHQIVTGAFRRGLGQERRFDFIETVVVHEIAQMTGDIPAQTHALLHDRPPQIDVAVAQTGFLADLHLAFQRERRSFCLVENLQPGG